MKNKWVNNFPFLKNNPDIVYLDSGATSLKLKAVSDRTMFYYNNEGFNINRSFNENVKGLEIEIDDTRKKIAKLVGSSKNQVIFTSGTTDSINYVRELIKDDLDKKEIVLGKFEHSSNYYPWVSLKNSRVLFLDVSEDLIITKTELEKVNWKDIKLLSIAFKHNTTGTVNDIEMISKYVKNQNSDCYILIDAAQALITEETFFNKWGIDFLVASSHKMFGPTGLGILIIKKNLLVDLKVTRFGGGMSSNYETKKFSNDKLYKKFEVGTLNIASILGFNQALDFILSNNKNEFKNHIENLIEYLERQLNDIDDIIIYNKNVKGKSSLMINSKFAHCFDIEEELSYNNIFIRSGKICSPNIMTILDGEECFARISPSIYNSKDDIDKLVYVLKNAKRYKAAQNRNKKNDNRFCS